MKASDFDGCGVPWFTAEDWPNLLAVAADRATLPDTHAEFEATAGRRFDRLREQGADIRKVVIAVADLVAWCAAARPRPLPVDALARAEFAAVTLARRANAH